MIQLLFAAHEERLQTLTCLMSLQIRRQGRSFRYIAKSLDISPKKAKQMVERGQALFSEATDEQLTALRQAQLRKAVQLMCGLAQLVMSRPPGGKDRN